MWSSLLLSIVALSPISPSSPLLAFAPAHRSPTMSESLLAQLDSMPQIRAFDAFPKTHQTYTTRSSRGGVFTILVSALIIYLAWYEMGAYFYGHPTTSFGVDHSMASEMQVNVDVTVNMKCHCEQAAGQRLSLVRIC